MIADAALRELFKTESEEHLQRLDDALLQLEKGPTNREALEEAFREAHSMKGAARMLGLNAIQAPAHRLEEQLNAARRDPTTINPNLLAAISAAVTEIRRLTLEALEDTTDAGATPAPTGPLRHRAAPMAPSPPTGANGATQARPFAIESIRVDTQKLDDLIMHVGELGVATARLSRRLADLDTLIDLADRWTDARAGSSEQTHATALLTRLHQGLSEDNQRLGYVAGELESAVHEMRLLPLSNVFRLFPRMVHDLGHEQGKRVELLLEGGDINADKRILEEIKDPLMHMLRNAVDHGIEPPQERQAAGKVSTGSVRIEARQSPGEIAVTVVDDGRGLDELAICRAAAARGLASEEALKAMSPDQVQNLIFVPGMSTKALVTDVSGRGVGMNVVRANVERLRGSIELQSRPGHGTRFTLRLPVALATMRVLIVAVNGHPYGIPMECVRLLRKLGQSDIFQLQGRASITHQERAIPVSDLNELLEPGPSPLAENTSPHPRQRTCAVLCHNNDCFAVFVDALVGEQDIVLKPRSALIEHVPSIVGATILDDGRICMVLSVQDLYLSVRTRASHTRATEPVVHKDVKKRLLLAEDSLVTRRLEARILEQAGYDVVTAADGRESWDRLTEQVFDAVITDITMPKLSGLELTEKIRNDPTHHELPVILVTSLASDEDRKRGLDMGASAYLTKAAFDQQILLECLQRLI